MQSQNINYFMSLQQLQTVFKQKLLFQIDQCSDIQALIFSKLNQIEQIQITSRLKYCEDSIFLLHSQIKNQSCQSKNSIVSYSKFDNKSLKAKIKSQKQQYNLHQQQIKVLQQQIENLLDNSSIKENQHKKYYELLDKQKKKMRKSLRKHADFYNKNIESLMQQNYELKRKINKVQKNTKKITIDNQDKTSPFFGIKLSESAKHKQALTEYNQYYFYSDYGYVQVDAQYQQQIVRRCKSDKYFTNYNKLAYLGEMARSRDKVVASKKQRLDRRLQQKYRQIKESTIPVKNLRRMPKTQRATLQKY